MNVTAGSSGTDCGDGTVYLALAGGICLLSELLGALPAGPNGFVDGLQRMLRSERVARLFARDTGGITRAETGGAAL